MKQLLLFFAQYVRLWIHYEPILSSRSDHKLWIIETLQDTVQIVSHIQGGLPIH